MRRKSNRHYARRSHRPPAVGCGSANAPPSPPARTAPLGAQGEPAKRVPRSYLPARRHKAQQPRNYRCSPTRGQGPRGPSAPMTRSQVSSGARAALRTIRTSSLRRLKAPGLNYHGTPYAPSTDWRATLNGGLAASQLRQSLVPRAGCPPAGGSSRRGYFALRIPHHFDTVQTATHTATPDSLVFSDGLTGPAQTATKAQDLPNLDLLHILPEATSCQERYCSVDYGAAAASVRDFITSAPREIVDRSAGRLG